MSLNLRGLLTKYPFYFSEPLGTAEPVATEASDIEGGSSPATPVSTISPFLKPGNSYNGKTSSTR